MPLVAAHSSGLLDFIRYAFMPNHRVHGMCCYWTADAALRFLEGEP